MKLDQKQEDLIREIKCLKEKIKWANGRVLLAKEELKLRKKYVYKVKLRIQSTADQLQLFTQQ